MPAMWIYWRIGMATFLARASGLAAKGIVSSRGQRLLAGINVKVVDRVTMDIEVMSHTYPLLRVH